MFDLLYLQLGLLFFDIPLLYYYINLRLYIYIYIYIYDNADTFAASLLISYYSFSSLILLSIVMISFYIVIFFPKDSL